jgi:membrane protein
MTPTPLNPPVSEFPASGFDATLGRQMRRAARQTGATPELDEQAQTPLQNWPWRQTLRTLRQRFAEDRLGLTAGSLTFTTLISLVPLLTVMLAVFSAFPVFSTFQAALQKFFLQSLVPDHIAKPVLAALTQFAAKSNRLGSAGFVALILSALAMMITIDRALNGIWRVQRSRAWGKRILLYWSAATLGPLVIGGSLAMTSLALSASKGWLGVSVKQVSWALAFTEWGLFVVGATALFYYVPNTHVRIRHALAGGLFVATVFELAKVALGWYLKTVPSYSVMYGAFATVPIFLIWLYLSWVIVLLGAVIAAYAPSLQMRVVRHEEFPGFRFSLAVALLGMLYRARAQVEHGCRVSRMALTLRTDPLQIQQVLEGLVQMGWVGRLSEPGEARFVLLCDPVHTPAHALMAEMLILPAHEPPGFSRRAGFERMMLDELLTLREDAAPHGTPT